MPSKKPKHIEQLERAGRWYQRVKEIADGRDHSVSTDFYEDEIHAFFINCYHVKDWIKNYPTVKCSSKDVEDYVNAHRDLQNLRPRNRYVKVSNL